ncbi:MAG: hypothetical protein K6E53_01010 [Lachnospiraceae bacterium]|nr:hypothetical protein [Lachnospiraceae bacterium]
MVIELTDAVVNIFSTTINKGRVIYRGEAAEEEKEMDLLSVDPLYIRKNIRGKRIAMVFQDPMTSLNPTMTIGKQLITVIRSHSSSP